MQPLPLDNELWSQIYDAMQWLVLLHLAVVLFAGSILMARAIIPSLIDTEDIPDRAGRLIPLFYASALVGFVGIIIFATLFLSDAGVVTDIYDRTWV